MIEEAYVSFEVAKLLKEKGFKELCRYYYLSSGNIHRAYGLKDRNYASVNTFSAPTLQMAMKWLREACGLTISIEFQAICSTWKWRIYIKASNKKHTDFQHYNKYEEACEAAIKYCLENLI